MSYLSAAEKVLRDAGEPLTTGEVTERAIRRGLLNPQSKTPTASMSAALYRAPKDSPIRRDFEPGPGRAARGTVRWTFEV
jgi:hypothetical protein